MDIKKKQRGDGEGRVLDSVKHGFKEGVSHGRSGGGFKGGLKHGVKEGLRHFLGGGGGEDEGKEQQQNQQQRSQGSHSLDDSNSAHSSVHCLDQFPGKPVDLRQMKERWAAIDAQAISAACKVPKPRTYQEKAQMLREKALERKARLKHDQVLNREVSWHKRKKRKKRKKKMVYT